MLYISNLEGALKFHFIIIKIKNMIRVEEKFLLKYIVADFIANTDIETIKRCLDTTFETDIELKTPYSELYFTVNYIVYFNNGKISKIVYNNLDCYDHSGEKEVFVKNELTEEEKSQIFNFANDYLEMIDKF